MLTHARLLEREGCEPHIIVGRGDPGSLGLSGQVIPELDSRHPDILKVQEALLAGEESAVPIFERWVERICSLLLDALEGVDVCIVHNAFTLHKNLPLSAALARLSSDAEAHVCEPRRWVAWCHDLAWTNPLYEAELLPRWPWSVLKTRLPNVCYVAISEQRRSEMAQLFGVPQADISLVPNGIDPGSFLPCSPEMFDVQSHLRWSERDWVFLAPVRVTRRKNLELAIRVTAAVRDKGYDPLLVITGPPGPHNIHSNVYLNELLAERKALQLEDNVAFLALEGDLGGAMEVSDALMYELYWWSDALLLTSVQEGFGLPLLEAGLARLPIFCTDLSVLREVGGGNAHYFWADEDPSQIADLMLQALSAPGPAALRRKVLGEYSWDAIFHSRLLPLLKRET
jgi:glycosyltransferase involved in cell wall biosynthesis